jgi:N-methylhydantoinase A
VISGESPKPTFPRLPEKPGPAASKESWRVYLEGSERDVPVFARADLAPGQFFTAPAIVTQSDCTTCIPSGFSGRVDAYRNLILTFDGKGK